MSATFQGKNVTVHSVPCRMRVQEGVSNAAVNSYFVSSMRNRGTDKCPSLRGRPLKGLELQIPSGCTAVVLHCADESMDQGFCELKECAKISNLHFWGLGTTPSQPPQALAWIHIAHSFHMPLPVDDK